MLASCLNHHFWHAWARLNHATPTRPPALSIEALSQRLGPSVLLDYASGATRPGQQPGQSAVALSSYQGGPPIVTLRNGLGLPQASASGHMDAERGSWAATSGPLSHVEDLRRLGERLLSGSGSNEGNDCLAPEVLVSAARQRLMAVEPPQLSMEQVQLLAADYALLTGLQAEQQLYQRCALLRPVSVLLALARVTNVMCRACMG